MNLEEAMSKFFEYFFNYLTVRNYTFRHFNPSDISLGKEEVGIDGVVITVNDILIMTMSKIEELFEVGKTNISVLFVLYNLKFRIL